MQSNNVKWGFMLCLLSSASTTLSLFVCLFVDSFSFGSMKNDTIFLNSSSVPISSAHNNHNNSQISSSPVMTSSSIFPSVIPLSTISTNTAVGTSSPIGSPRHNMPELDRKRSKEENSRTHSRTGKNSKENSKKEGSQSHKHSPYNTLTEHQVIIHTDNKYIEPSSSPDEDTNTPDYIRQKQITPSNANIASMIPLTAPLADIVRSSSVSPIQPFSPSSVDILMSPSSSAFLQHTGAATSIPSSTSFVSLSSVTTGSVRQRYDVSCNIERQKIQKRLFEQGILKFNENPNKGIEYLLANGLLEDTPDAISEFLHNTSGLKKSQIGDYLGDADPKCLSVMFAYVNRLDFTNSTLPQALRYFLSGFRLPGEAQKIDRMVEKFAERFCRDNPTAFTEQDAAYLLAYSLIILNTDAHSPNVKNKMKKSDFLRNCRELFSKYGLSRDFLSDCFDDITKNEIKINLDYLEQLYSRVQVNNLSAVKLAKRRKMLVAKEKEKVLAKVQLPMQLPFLLETALCYVSVRLQPALVLATHLLCFPVLFVWLAILC